MYIVYAKDGNFNFTGNPDNPGYLYNIGFYNSKGGNLLQVAGDKWISALMVRDHLYKLVFTDQFNTKKFISIRLHKGAVFSDAMLDGAVLQYAFISDEPEAPECLPHLIICENVKL